MFTSIPIPSVSKPYIGNLPANWARTAPKIAGSTNDVALIPSVPTI